MIHLFEIDSSMTLQQVKKLSRRYAMTGGYELALQASMTSDDLYVIYERFSKELESYQGVNSERLASNAHRILSLVLEHPSADSVLKEKVRHLI